MKRDLYRLAVRLRSQGVSYDDAMGELSEHFIIAEMEAQQGSKAKAAAALGMTQKALTEILENLRPPLTSKDYEIGDELLDANDEARNDWREFVAWCLVNGKEPLPAEVETVNQYLIDTVERLTSDVLTRQMKTIYVIHQRAGYKNPGKVPYGLQVYVEKKGVVVSSMFQPGPAVERPNRKKAE